MANQNNNNQKRTVNTKLIQLYNNESADPGTITLGVWENFASIQINPELPKNEQVDGKVYDYNKPASILLNAEAVTTFYEGLLRLERNEKLEADKRKVYSISVRTSDGTKVITIGSGGVYEEFPEKYLALFVFKEGNVLDGEAYYHLGKAQKNFDNTLMLNFDEREMTFKSVKIDTQYLIFKKYIELMTECLNFGGAHGTNKSLDIRLNRFKKEIEELMGNSSNSSSNNRDSGFSSSSRSRRGRTMLPDSQVTSDDEDDDTPTPVPTSRRSSKSTTKDTSSSKNVSNSKKSKKSEKTVNDMKSLADDIADDMDDMD